MASSLALYYRFNMSAGATSVPDLSGNGLTGLLPNGGTFNNDFLYLNSANNQWVNISSGIKPYLNTQDYSIMGCVVSKNPAAWARFFDFNTKYQTGISASDVYWEGTFNYQGANKIGYEIRNTNLYYSSGGSTATITGGKWQHVAWVGNPSHVNIYLNGNSVFTNSLGATPSNFYPSSFYTSLMNFGIGKSWDNTNQYCNMDIYNFKVYTAALTPADLKAEGEACLSQNPTTSPTNTPTKAPTTTPTAIGTNILSNGCFSNPYQASIQFVNIEVGGNLGAWSVTQKNVEQIVRYWTVPSTCGCGTSLDLSGGGSISGPLYFGQITQTLATEPNGWYNVSCYVAGNFFVGGAALTRSGNFTWGGALLDIVTVTKPPSYSPSNMGWELKYWIVNASSSSTNFQMTDLNGQGGGMALADCRAYYLGSSNSDAPTSVLARATDFTGCPTAFSSAPTVQPTTTPTQSPTTFPTFAPPPPNAPVEPLQQGVVCGPEISLVRRHLSSADHGGDHGDRTLLQGYTPQTCYEACVARLGPTPEGFVINLYYNENGEQVCTCCRECEGVRYVPSAQLYAVCSAATSGGLTLATATSPRRVVRPGRTVRYKVSLRPATKQPKAKATSQAAGGPTLNLRVALPAGVRYMQSTTSPPLLAYSAGGRKAKRQPVLANDSAVLTWEDIGVTRKGRDFVVKVRVDSAIASGTPLTFSAQLFESVQVGAGTSAVPACPRSAPNATVTVV